MSDSASVPPPSLPPPVEGGRAQPAQHRVITLPLDHGDTRGSWRKKLGGGGHAGERYIRLVGSEIVFEHPESLLSPLTIAAGMVAVAVTDHGGADQAGRFPILRRLSRTAVVPRSDGVEGWLWTAESGSALPMLGDGSPNLALVFIKPLEPDRVEAVFRPDFVAALAQRSALGAPTIFGLLARVSDIAAAESAFVQLGVSDVVTDREVAPAQRRHLPTDRPADPSIGPMEDRRREGSVGPPGA